MVGADDPACERCGADDGQTTRNRLPDGETYQLCYECVRKVSRRMRQQSRQGGQA